MDCRAEESSREVGRKSRWVAMMATGKRCHVFQEETASRAFTGKCSGQRKRKLSEEPCLKKKFSDENPQRLSSTEGKERTLAAAVGSFQPYRSPNKTRISPLRFWSVQFSLHPTPMLHAFPLDQRNICDCCITYSPPLSQTCQS